jgi:hypothetical protein
MEIHPIKKDKRDAAIVYMNLPTGDELCSIEVEGSLIALLEIIPSWLGMGKYGASPLPKIRPPLSTRQPIYKK